MWKSIMMTGCLLLGLSACGSDDWLGEKEAPPLEGNRLPILSDRTELRVSPTLEKRKVDLPDPITNPAWLQAPVSTDFIPPHLALSGEPEVEATATIGEGEAWGTRLAASPVAGDGMVYAMDGSGFVSEHRMEDIDEVAHIYPAGGEDGIESGMGGGLVYLNHQLYTVTGDGQVALFDTRFQKEIWRMHLNMPIRAAPVLYREILYVSGIDSQLFALDAKTGETKWRHQGYADTAGYLGSASVSVVGPAVIMPYSTGEIAGLRSDSGGQVWIDTLSLSRKTRTLAGLADIDADPVSDRGRVYAVSNNGLLAALDVVTGRRIWEQEMSSGARPWIAGRFLFVLTQDDQLAAVHAPDGRIKWIRDLPRYEDEEEKEGRLHWAGPVLAGGRLWLTGSHGELLGLDPADGDTVLTVDIPDGVFEPPVVADKTMYLVTRDATLVAVR